MLIQRGNTRSGEADRHLAWSLASIAGALNTDAFELLRARVLNAA